MMKIYSVDQGTPEWHELRLGKMTASNAQCIAANGKGLETYCRILAAEIFTGGREGGYTSEAMERGIEEEHIARKCYELEYGVEVEEVGFAEYSERAGGSPDGLVGVEGGVEIKRQNMARHNDILLGASDFDSKYIWQCRMLMLITDRNWWDLISYNPLFKDRSLFVKRIDRDPICDEKLLQGFERGVMLIAEYLKILNKKSL